MTNENGLRKQQQWQDTTRAHATSHRNRWTSWELDTLQEVLEANEWHLTSEKALEIAELFGRTYGAIIVKTSDLREARRMQMEHLREHNRLTLKRLEAAGNGTGTEAGVPGE